MDDNERLSNIAKDQHNGNLCVVSSSALLVQILFWLIFIITTVWVLARYPDVPSIQNEYYPIIIASGLALVAITPVASLLVWALVRKNRTEGFGGGFFSLLIKSAAVTAAGTIAWFAALLLLDIWRLGFV